MANGKNLYSLIPLNDFKFLMGIDDRDDKLARFCLVTSTLSIEHHCKRKLLRKKIFEQIEFTGDLVLPLREYPVTKVLVVYVFTNPHPCGFVTSEFASQTPAKAMVTPPSMAGEILEPEFYSIIPDYGLDFDLPFCVSLSPALKRYPALSAVKVGYIAGYPLGSVPADLASACMELAMWNFNRYRGKRVGMTGNIRGAGKEGEHFEASMPENVKALLEPYRRKTI